jgi:hypothetical protein
MIVLDHMMNHIGYVLTLFLVVGRKLYKKTCLFTVSTLLVNLNLFDNAALFVAVSLHSHLEQHRQFVFNSLYLSTKH